MTLSAAIALCSLLATNHTGTTDQFDLKTFEVMVSELPSAAKPVDNCDRLIELTNRLIEIGPLETWNLIDRYLARQPVPVKTLKAYVATPDPKWCQTLVLLGLLIERDNGGGGELGSITVVPTYYEDGLIFQSFFLYFPNELTPNSLRSALRTIDWSKFRKTPIKLKPERATTANIKEFLNRWCKERGFIYPAEVTVAKQNPTQFR